MPRILFSHAFPGGGVARVTMDIARYCRQYAPEFEIFVASREFGEGFDSPEIQSVIMGCIRTDNLYKTALEIGADIVVPCSFMDKGAPRLRKKGIKLIFANHGDTFHEQYIILDHRMGGKKKHWWMQLLWKLGGKRKYVDRGGALKLAKERVRRNYRNSDAFVLLCEGYRREAAEAVLPDSPDRFYVINNTEYPVANPRLDKEKMVLYVGRLNDYDKKPERLLRIWRQAQDRLPEHRLVIVGDGPERPRLEAMARELGLERYSFEGWDPNPSHWYRDADILCLVSQTEGWGLCLTEALANGTLCIAFNCSAGVEEILRETGFTVPHPDEQAFAETLVRVGNMEEKEKTALRLAGIRRVEAFAPEKIGAQWVALFRHLLSS